MAEWLQKHKLCIFILNDEVGVFGSRWTLLCKKLDQMNFLALTLVLS